MLVVLSLNLPRYAMLTSSMTPISCVSSFASPILYDIRQRSLALSTFRAWSPACHISTD